MLSIVMQFNLSFDSIQLNLKRINLVDALEMFCEVVIIIFLY